MPTTRRAAPTTIDSGATTNDRGATTVETALALASLVLVLAAALYGLAATADQVRCVDAAREAARLAARGETDQMAKEVAHRIAPPNAEITIAREGDHLKVTVKASPSGGLLPGLQLTAEAFAMTEPVP
jgi:Flp pilus assembly protein TadG